MDINNSKEVKDFYDEILKAKYISRTGSPGNYKYVYPEDQSGKSKNYKTRGKTVVDIYNTVSDAAEDAYGMIDYYKNLTPEAEKKLQDKYDYAKNMLEKFKELGSKHGDKANVRLEKRKDVVRMTVGNDHIDMPAEWFKRYGM